MKKLYVRDRKAWRSWLAKNHVKAKEVWLISYKKGTGRLSVPYNDAVEEALCYGWIDSTVKRLDEKRYAQRYTPRKSTSVLSQPNKERLEKLIANKKMTKAGLAAVSHVYKPVKKASQDFKIPLAILRALKADKTVWKNFQALPDSYKRIRVMYIETRKRHSREMYEKALANFIRKTRQNKKFGYANV